MAVVDEIAIKLGIESGDLQAVLADSNAKIQGFAKDGSKGMESLTESIHGVHSSMRVFHQFLVGGGIVEALKGFFEMAIKSAEASKDANDENAAAVRRFGDTFKDVHGGVGSLAMELVGTFNRVGESIGEGTRYAIEFWQAQITGNDANLKAFDQAQQSERAAEEQERAFAIEKQKYGEDFKRVNAEIAQTKAQINDAELKTMTAEQKLSALAEDRAKIESEMASGKLNRLQLQERELELLKNQKAEMEAQAQLDKEFRTSKEAQNKAADEARLKGLTTAEKQKALAIDIATEETTISTLKKEGYDTTVLEAQLNDRKLAQTKLTGDAEAERVKKNETIAGSVKEELEYLGLQHKAVLGITTGPEQLRLQQITLERQEREKQGDLDELAKIAMQRDLNPAEQKKYDTLTLQKTKLDEQMAVVTGLIAATKEQATAAAQVTDEYTKQVEAASQLSSINGFRGTVTQQGDLRQLDAVQLQALIDKEGKALPTMQQSDRSNKSVFDLTNGETVETAMVRTTLEAAQAEQKTRQEFQFLMKTFGQAYVEAAYSPTEYARLSGILSPDLQKQQAADINSISTTLAKVFPTQANNIR